jgi:hypothetical protein
MDRALSSMFVLGRTPSRSSDERSRMSEPVNFASLSYEELGGVEYSALRVLLKIVAGERLACNFSICWFMIANLDRLFLRSACTWRALSTALDLDCEP